MRIDLEFTAKNAMGGRVRDRTTCGFKTASDVVLDPNDKPNKDREFVRNVNSLGRFR